MFGIFAILNAQKSLLLSAIVSGATSSVLSVALAVWIATLASSFSLASVNTIRNYFSS